MLGITELDVYLWERILVKRHNRAIHQIRLLDTEESTNKYNEHECECLICMYCIQSMLYKPVPILSTLNTSGLLPNLRFLSFGHNPVFSITPRTSAGFQTWEICRIINVNLTQSLSMCHISLFLLGYASAPHF